MVVTEARASCSTRSAMSRSATAWASAAAPRAAFCSARSHTASVLRCFRTSSARAMAPTSSRRPVPWTGVSSWPSHQLRDRPSGVRRRHDQHELHMGRQRVGGEVRVGIERQRGEQRLVHQVRRCDQCDRRAVRQCLGNRIRTDDARSAGAILPTHARRRGCESPSGARVQPRCEGGDWAACVAREAAAARGRVATQFAG